MIHLTYPDRDGNPQGRTICGKPNGPDTKWRKSQPPNCPDCIKCQSDPPGTFRPPQRRQRA